jgi:hypothetical protein
LAERAAWPEQPQWLLKTLVAFHRAFADRIKGLDADTAALAPAASLAET